MAALFITLTALLSLEEATKDPSPARTWKPEETRRSSPVDGRELARGDVITGKDEEGNRIFGHKVNELGDAGFWVDSRNGNLDPFVPWANPWDHA